MAKKYCKAAVFFEAGKPLELTEFELPRTVEPGAALCRVRMSTICGSDLHTVSGRRIEQTPLILGHEIIGEVVELGDGLSHDGFGDRLNTGDRISWSVTASCGNCFFCSLGLPQKCEHLRKYGHTSCKNKPALTGGYAEYIYLFPGTAIFRVPDELPDETATPANCALSTVINAVETIGINTGEKVLIQGAGLLGLNLVALARETGAGKIIVTDINQARLNRALQFGADICINLRDMDAGEIVPFIRSNTNGYGVDTAFEVCGVKEAVSQAVEALRIGGRYLIAGLVMPGSELAIEGNQVTRKYLTIKGIHNYNPAHLGKALKFLENHHRKYPYAELVGKIFPLDEINEALKIAATGEYIRVGIKAW